MGNREVNYPDILPQEQPPKRLSLSCNAHVKIDVNVYNTTTRNDINSWIKLQAMQDAPPLQLYPASDKFLMWNQTKAALAFFFQTLTIVIHVYVIIIMKCCTCFC